ncbi:MAG: hypothetical protein HOM58_16615 [Rhodospirillaceae bacterium]|jgi:hypothetical protein|nr:hypothetical protein [Rhodospirillaceae bacterium]MBT5455425.1 hypothetical protein [Rhodospirillaceae bacterium]
MIESARLPPIYRFVPLGPDDDPMARAKERALEGADPATIFCIDSATLLDCAVILHPHMDFAKSKLVIYAGMLGLGDAIGSVVPAGIDLTYRWPNRMEANLGLVAHVRLSAPPDLAENSVPPWLTLRVTAAVSGAVPDGRDGGNYQTTLLDEGAADLTTIQLLESFSRHFLSWTSRWQDDGFSPLRAMWVRHSVEEGEEVEISLGDLDFRGAFEAIDDDGALLLRHGDVLDRIPLDAFLDN